MSTKKLLATILIFTLMNFGLTFILISILADGLLSYKSGFYVIAPFIFMLTFVLFSFSIHQNTMYKRKQISELNFTATILFVLMNSLILLFNYYCWIDLFDGSTDALLP